MKKSVQIKHIAECGVVATLTNNIYRDVTAVFLGDTQLVNNHVEEWEDYKRDLECYIDCDVTANGIYLGRKIKLESLPDETVIMFSHKETKVLGFYPTAFPYIFVSPKRN